MGDILSGIFGGGSRTSSNTQPDAISQALNAMRFNQLTSLFDQNSYGQFGIANPGGEYSPSSAVENLRDQMLGPENTMSLADYQKLGLDATSNYISQVATPQIMQQASLQGLDAGGMVPEAIAKATAGIALPFIQSLPQAGLMNAQRASTLMPLGDYSRGLAEQDLLRRQGVVTTGLTGIPYTPGSYTAGRQSTQPLWNFFGQG